MSALIAPTGPRAYIGGGNIAGIIGVSPFRSPLDEYHTIIGDSPELSAANEAFFKRRRALEPFAAAVLAERGFHVVEQNRRLTDHDYPFFRAELDAETLVDGTMRNSEFKSVNPFASKGWGNDGDPDGAPAYVTAQAQWGLPIAGRKNCDILAVIGFDESRVYPVEYADDVVGFLRKTALHFWEQHVLPRVPPAPTSVEDILNWIVPDPGKSIEASDSTDLARALDAFLLARTAAKEADDELEKLKAQIQLAMCDATSLTRNGKTVLTWRANKDSIVTDWKGLVADLNPSASAIEKFTSTKAGARVFRVAVK